MTTLSVNTEKYDVAKQTDSQKRSTPVKLTFENLEFEVNI